MSLIEELCGGYVHFRVSGACFNEHENIVCTAEGINSDFCKFLWVSYPDFLRTF